MDMILQTHSLTLFATNQVFTATQVNAVSGNQVLPMTQAPTVYVGTNPPSGQTCSVVRYKHPVDFGVLFEGGNGWLASLSDKIGYSYAPIQDMGNFLERGEPEVKLPKSELLLQSGLYMFYFGDMAEEQFQALVFHESIPLGLETNIEFKTEAQREREEIEILIPKRIEMARSSESSESIDKHNLEVLSEDLKSVLLDRTQKGACTEFEIAFDWNTGKLIALRREIFSQRVDWPAFLPRLFIIGYVSFNSSTRKLEKPFVRDLFGQRPVPVSLERAIRLFNGRFR